jgi:hypothetical protein
MSSCVHTFSTPDPVAISMTVLAVAAVSDTEPVVTTKSRAN